jgi:hypothetical protein
MIDGLPPPPFSCWSPRVPDGQKEEGMKIGKPRREHENVPADEPLHVPSEEPVKVPAE